MAYLPQIPFNFWEQYQPLVPGNPIASNRVEQGLGGHMAALLHGRPIALTDGLFVHLTDVQ